MVQRIREIHDEEDRITEQHRKEVEAFYKERVPSVPYASEYKDDKGKCRYTKAQIKAYDVYQRKLEELRKTPEYKTLDQKHWDEHRKLWDETRKLEKALSEKDYEKFREQTKGKYVAYITYSDNDGDGMAAMEHGDIWNRIQHIKISHH
jgi:L-rhamnose mutarotase